MSGRAEDSALALAERATMRDEPGKTAAVQGMAANGGLTAAEVAERIARGDVNAVDEGTSRRLRDIVRANVLTRFNAILGVLFVVVILVGSPRDALFGGVLVANAVIGIGQEWRAKRTLDRLAVLHAPRATVVRDGRQAVIEVGQVVLGDIVRVRTGDQIVADGTVRHADGLEIDEALLTGESDPVDKKPGDQVLSGSIVVAGHGAYETTAVGANAYAHRLAAEARRFTTTRSELVEGTNRLLGYITWVLVVVGPVLLVSQLARHHSTTKDVLVGTVAALVGMVPEGLVLLTSLAFLVAALTLARRQVLVQELPAVEGLARVDVVCLDKTGTLTEGEIVFDRVIPIGPIDEQLSAALAALASLPEPNATQQALAAAFPPNGEWDRSAAVPFSSARKWSAASFHGTGTWVIGAPELILAPAGSDHPVRRQADAEAADGQRVLLVACTDAPLEGSVLPPGLRSVGLVTFTEKIRSDAGQTMRYFVDQGVRLKVLSGDSPRTVGAVARRVGVPDADEPVDARTLPDEPGALADTVEAHTVFGRVTPQQKRLVVGALQSNGHVVAMTGDGVNDALALKDADIGVAMGNGAPATRAVAQLVLLDSQFAHMPGVVAEGRRVIANIERVASLFLVKNVYSAMLAVVVAVAGLPFPFLPRHLTVISGLTIGIPAFVLSFAPNTKRYTPGFLVRVLRFSVPVGVLIAVATFAAYATARALDFTGDEGRTAATVVVMVSGLRVLVVVARPLQPWKIALIAAMGGLFVLTLIVPAARRFFSLEAPIGLLAVAAVIAVAAALVLGVVARLAERQPDVPVTVP